MSSLRPSLCALLAFVLTCLCFSELSSVAVALGNTREQKVVVGSRRLFSSATVGQVAISVP